jgi:intracellular multiplication protein IcmG
MADKDDNEEYHFSDYEEINSIQNEDEQVVSSEVVQERKYTEGTNIRRNALIVVGVILLALILYKLFSSFFSPKVSTENEPIPPAIQQPKLSSATPVVTKVSTINNTQPVANNVKVIQDQVERKISTIEVSQQSIRAEVDSMGNQLGGMNNNLTNLTTQISQLQQTISDLSTKIDAQAVELERAKAPKAAKVSQRKNTKKSASTTRYYIQAVIPGRAWLIASNGSTLTVREGTLLKGYGTIKLIDPNQGRILTSSGQIIRFSQEDS